MKENLYFMDSLKYIKLSLWLNSWLIFVGVPYVFENNMYTLSSVRFYIFISSFQFINHVIILYNFDFFESFFNQFF